MKKKKSQIAIFLSVAAGIWWIQSTMNSSSHPSETAASLEQSSQTLSSSVVAVNPSLARISAQSHENSQEWGALQDMVKNLKQFTSKESRLGDLVQYLESSRQDPVVTHDANPDTGEMVIVRTNNPLPGTRYFHAQYFNDESQNEFVQHMSFEFKPGPQAMAEGLAAVRSSFGDLPAPQVERADYVKWNLPDGYILWVKKMTAEDLQDDPFNAYTPDDVGTIRVAMELEIHDNNHH